MVEPWPGWPAPKNPPGEAMDGGEAGDEGPPLDVLGGFMRFSFCRLLKNRMKVEHYQILILTAFKSNVLPVAKPDSDNFLLHVETVGYVGDFFRSRFRVLIECPLESYANRGLDGSSFFTSPT